MLKCFFFFWTTEKVWSNLNQLFDWVPDVSQKHTISPAGLHEPVWKARLFRLSPPAGWERTAPTIWQRSCPLLLQPFSICCQFFLKSSINLSPFWSPLKMWTISFLISLYHDCHKMHVLWRTTFQIPSFFYLYTSFLTSANSSLYLFILSYPKSLMPTQENSSHRYMFDVCMRERGVWTTCMMCA